MATVRLRGPLRRLAGGDAEHDIPGGTVNDLLQALESSHPAIRGWVLDERGAVREHINVFVNGELAAIETSVAEGDGVDVLPAISGGR